MDADASPARPPRGFQVTCTICGDRFEPRHRHAHDCPDCRAWASRPMFGLPAVRVPWQQAKRFGAGLDKRAALREPAVGVRWADPRETVRVRAIR